MKWKRSEKEPEEGHKGEMSLLQENREYRQLQPQVGEGELILESSYLNREKVEAVEDRPRWRQRTSKLKEEKYGVPQFCRLRLLLSVEKWRSWPWNEIRGVVVERDANQLGRSNTVLAFPSWLSSNTSRRKVCCRRNELDVLCKLDKPNLSVTV